jgi:DNA-binding Xre family transcriptional regulator
MKTQPRRTMARKSPAQVARIKALRAKYKDRPTPEELLASGDYTPPVPLGVYLQIKQLMRQLKDARSKAKLSLADLCARTHIDRSYLSKLENLQQTNTTLETVSRIADALGLELALRPAARG